MNTINFSSNWNNKLNCEYFTTIRIYNPIKHKIGNKFNVFLGKKLKIKAEIIGIKKGFAKDLNEYDCYLDTGYNKQETITILQKIYPKTNLKHKVIVLILLKRIAPPKPQQIEIFNK
ncbi:MULTISPECIES: hypothetical protein [Tenacibaculum]|uniref:hypothetical protein n=1 Tax=Tenacibaculum TaxID=104267 RepID=UPI001EFD6BCF|nr:MULTISPECIES: hypothetical protein [Tenacibaculum]MCG8208843.1 hypothetical protein [Tenacibaculum finnmarkense genomovar finnmarkense]MCG8224414.1 hypothetical protein [Tenacibaculum finnmarkense genomovar finnmarkense]MCG8713999.1 hypothetical protein [Tenacibaculum finnmarkense]MCG8737067.1 hypothetical protein [Tenacibaculum finnmarkense]MCG8766173.1 hypothetical protein [Tenacibaculum finnmarkense]